MIGQIRGNVLAKSAPEVLVDVQGVGYELLVSLSTFFDLPDVGEAVALHTHFVVREDAQLLYGFSSIDERSLFRSLIKVSGVGPKMALGVLSGMSAKDFTLAVHSNDVNALVKLPGVGKKTAERLVVEMKDRLDTSSQESTLGESTKKQVDVGQEAESALIALGYKPQDAARMISNVQTDEALSAEQLIRSALKSMVLKP
jgi:Holliday junction DNA helicase RuvA